MLSVDPVGHSHTVFTAALLTDLFLIKHQI